MTWNLAPDHEAIWGIAVWIHANLSSVLELNDHLMFIGPCIIVIVEE